MRWEREYTATEYGAPCVQFMDFHKNDRFAGENMKAESEDCLHLNIFSPYVSAKSLTWNERLFHILYNKNDLRQYFLNYIFEHFIISIVKLVMRLLYLP